MVCFGRWDAFEVKNAENMMEISGCEGRSNLKMWPFFFSLNSCKSKRDVRKLRKDSLLSEFSCHVVLSSKKFWVKFAL